MRSNGVHKFGNIHTCALYYIRYSEALNFLIIDIIMEKNSCVILEIMLLIHCIIMHKVGHCSHICLDSCH